MRLISCLGAAACAVPLTRSTQSRPCPLSENLRVRAISLESSSERRGVLRYVLQSCPEFEFFPAITPSSKQRLAEVYARDILVDMLQLSPNITNEALTEAAVSVDLDEYLRRLRATRRHTAGLSPGEFCLVSSNIALIRELLETETADASPVLILEDDARLHLLPLFVHGPAQWAEGNDVAADGVMLQRSVPPNRTRAEEEFNLVEEILSPNVTYGAVARFAKMSHLRRLFRVFASAEGRHRGTRMVFDHAHHIRNASTFLPLAVVQSNFDWGTGLRDSSGWLRHFQGVSQTTFNALVHFETLSYLASLVQLADSTVSPYNAVQFVLRTFHNHHPHPPFIAQTCSVSLSTSALSDPISPAVSLTTIIRDLGPPPIRRVFAFYLEKTWRTFWFGIETRFRELWQDRPPAEQVH